MKVVYSFNHENRQATGVQIKDNDYVLQSNETLVEPNREEYPPYTLNADGTAWSGLTLEEYQAQNKSKSQSAAPSKTDILTANLMKMMAKMSMQQDLKIKNMQATIDDLQSKIQ